MKPKLIVTVLLIVFIVVSCTPAVTVIPETATVILTTTASQTPTPPETNTPEATATEKVAVLTPRQQEFLDQGYDELSSLEDGVIYGILDESSVEYMPDGGVEFGEGGHALSTVEVTYYNPETKQFEKGTFVLDWSIPTGFDDGTFITYPVETGGIGVDAVVLPQFLIKNCGRTILRLQ
ncbi:MAG: hypothetical protein J0M11_14530 [Anaerolineae bacterium]|nr:hypothetical protein [Anaerolineae bacterium]